MSLLFRPYDTFKQLVNRYFPVKSVFAKTAALSHLELASRRKQTFRSEKIIIIVHHDCVIVQKCLITQHLQIMPLSYLKIDVFLISLSHAVATSKSASPSQKTECPLLQPCRQLSRQPAVTKSSSSSDPRCLRLCW